jgi:hypothetical protein
VKGREAIFIDDMIDISCELVRNRSLGAGAEELCFCLKVVKTILEFGNGSRKVGDNFNEVVICI